MHVNALEQVWVWIVGILTAAMLGVIFYTAFAIGQGGLHPPSNVETIDSSALHLSDEFAEANLGVKRGEDGTIHITMVGAKYGFYPQEVVVPVDTPVTLRMASADTIHGFHVKGSNMASMLIPGYVSEVSTVFKQTGEFPMFCNEYCGVGHHYMWSRFRVVSQDEFDANDIAMVGGAN